MKWYVMNVFNNWEKKVKEKIEKEIEQRNMVNKLGRIVIPKEKVTELRRGKKIEVERSYFPGYMMIECDMNGELLKVIRNIDGVVSFLGQNKPEPMSDKEVKIMLHKVDKNELSKKEAIKIDFNIGDKIKIIDGPFNTMNAIVKDICYEKSKVMVEVNIFNRLTPIDLSFEQVMVNNEKPDNV